MMIQRWLKVSGIGLGVSAASWIAGELILQRLAERPSPAWLLGVRVVAAILAGWGMGFTLFFAIPAVAGVLFWLQERRKI